LSLELYGTPALRSSEKPKPKGAIKSAFVFNP